MSAEDVLARAEEAMRRHGTQPRLAQRARAVQRRAFMSKLKRVVGIGAIFAVGLPLMGLLVGSLSFGVLALSLLVFAATAGVALMVPARETAQGEVLPTTELALLPLKTEEWLASQRRALPAPAARLADGIGLKLEALAPQLQMLDEREPAAAEVRRLIADELPELVRGYQRVPENLRRDGLNGMSPDKQLVDGLAVVDSELQRMSEQLAAGDLNKIATQARYLELKYQGDSAS